MRVVLNTKTNKYEIHRTNFFMHQEWQNTDAVGGYWWTYYLTHTSRFDTPEQAMCAYNASRGRPKSLGRFVTVKRFW